MSHVLSHLGRTNSVLFNCAVLFQQQQRKYMYNIYSLSVELAQNSEPGGGKATSHVLEKATRATRSAQQRGHTAGGRPGWRTPVKLKRD